MSSSCFTHTKFHENIFFPFSVDYTRVPLSDYPGVPGSDYINANYIKVRSCHNMFFGLTRFVTACFISLAVSCKIWDLLTICFHHVTLSCTFLAVPFLIMFHLWARADWFVFQSDIITITLLLNFLTRVQVAAMLTSPARVPCRTRSTISGGWSSSARSRSSLWLATNRRPASTSAKTTGTRTKRRKSSSESSSSSCSSPEKSVQTSWSGRCDSAGPLTVARVKRNERCASSTTRPGPTTACQPKSNLCSRWFDSFVTAKLQRRSLFW